MSSKLHKLEAMVAVLEQAVGINPDTEVITQRTDGSWPQPKTDAPVIIERVCFSPSVSQALIENQRKIEAALVAEIEAQERLKQALMARRMRRIQ